MAENEAFVYTTLAAIGVVGAVILANKIKEKVLTAQIAAYNIDLLKQKKEGLSKDKIASAQAKAQAAATDLRAALEHKIGVEKKYQAKLAEAERNGTPIEAIQAEYTAEMAKEEAKVAEAQATYNTLQGESLSLQKEAFDVSQDLRSNLASVPGILGMIITGLTTMLIKRKAGLAIGKQENAQDKKGLLLNAGKNAAK